MRFPFSLGPIARVALGLTSLLVSLVMLSDLFLGVLPHQAELELKTRQRLVENLAGQVTVFVTGSDMINVGRSLQQMLSQNPDMLSSALRTVDGVVVAQRGDHQRHWSVKEESRSRWNHLRVGLNANGKAWGQLEVTFAPAEQIGRAHV